MNTTPGAFFARDAEVHQLTPVASTATIRDRRARKLSPVKEAEVSAANFSKDRHWDQKWKQVTLQKRALSLFHPSSRGPLVAPLLFYR